MRKVMLIIAGIVLTGTLAGCMDPYPSGYGYGRHYGGYHHHYHGSHYRHR